MKLRTEDHLGFFSTQMLGQLALPHVARAAVKQMNRVPVDGTDSSPGPAPAADTKRDPAPTCQKCGGALGGMFGSVCMNCDVDTDTFASVDSGRYPGTLAEAEPQALAHFWWLSYADDERCAGVAVVRLAGEQSGARAAERARTLGLEPAGKWEIAAFQAPEEERALMEAHADRFLTTEEAAAAFQAQSLGSFEQQNPGKVLDTSEVTVMHTEGAEHG